MPTMFWQKQYDQITVSTSSLASLEFEEDSTTEFDKTEEEEALKKKSMLAAKIEKTIKTIEETKEQRRSSIEEGSTGLLADSSHSNADSKFLQMDANEPRKRASDLSVPEQHQPGNKQKAKASGLSVSDHGTTGPVPINRKSNLDLDALQQSNPLKAADSRRRRNSTNDEPSVEDKRRARLSISQNGRRRASIAGGMGQKGKNCRELVSERVETRPRLRKFGSNRTLSDDSDSIGLQRKSRESGGARVRRSGSSRKLSTDSGESIRIIQSSLQSNLGRRKFASALSLSEHGCTHRNSGSKAQSVASRRRELARSSSLILAGNPNERFEQSPSETSNFTWTWRSEEMEPALKRSNQSSAISNTSPSPTTKVVSSRTLRQDFISSTPPSGKTTRRLSIPPSCDFARSDHPMSSLKTAQRQRQRQKKISPKRTSKCGDSLLSPGARRNSRAKEHLVSPNGRQSSYPNLPLATPDSKTKSNFKKTRGSSVRRQASKSNIIALQAANVLELPIAPDDVVNKTDIGAIAKFLKQSNQAEEELLRLKEEEREAKRSHVRARRRQPSLEFAW